MDSTELQRDAPARADSDSHEAVLERPSTRSLARMSNREMALQVVQQYVETERLRNRRILVWVSTIFLFIIVFVLVVFVAVGITVLSRSQDTTELVEDLQVKTAVYASDLVDVAGRLEGVEEGAATVQDALVKAEQARDQDGRVLKSDLKRFSQWVDERTSVGNQTVETLEKRLSRMEEEATAREQELARVREQYVSLGAMLAAERSRVNPAMNGLAEPAGSAQTEPVVPGDPPTGTKSVVSTDASPNVEVSIVTYSNGDRYEGQFRDGLFDGWGVYYYANGERYEGEFSRDIREGRGTLVYENGDRYTGEFKDDMVSGKGTLVYRNGNRYIGDFKNGLRHGSGVLTYRNGDMYKGDFLEDQRTGRGSYSFSDGARYIGDFLEGRRHGEGRYVYPGGEEYMGEFRDGQKHGIGECVYPNGDRIKGVWKEDKFIRVLDQ